MAVRMLCGCSTLMRCAHAAQADRKARAADAKATKGLAAGSAKKKKKKKKKK